jgi:hypothetical protein
MQIGKPPLCYFFSRILLVPAIPFLLIGCQNAEPRVLLRYTPQVGETYRYALTIRQPNNPIEVTGDMHVLSKQEDGYRVQFSGVLAHEVFSRAMTISDRHNASDPGYVSLNFPDDPVTVDTEWSGVVPWYFENYYVLDPTEMNLPATYRLLEIEKGESGRLAVIEQSTDVDVAVNGLVLQVGQVGVRWDERGTITEEANVVRFAVLRAGQKQQIEVEKSTDELAVVKVGNVKGTLRTTFDVDRGILLWAEATINQEDVDCTSATIGTFPIVDDYGGLHKFGYLKGKTTYQDHLGSERVAWTLSLVE